MITTFSAQNSLKYARYKVATDLFPPPSSPKPQSLLASQGNASPPLNKHEIDKNNALKRLYNVLTILSFIVAGGFLGWLYTFSNTSSQEWDNQKARIDVIYTFVENLKQERNRDIDDIREDIRDLQITLPEQAPQCQGATT